MVIVICFIVIPPLSAQTKIYVGTNGYSMTTAVALADTDTSSSANSLINPLNETAAAQASADYVDEAAEVPFLLKGIWYNTNRYIIFDHGFSSELKDSNGFNRKAQIPQIVLRMFYTWYDDRAAEAAAYTKQTGSKTINTAGADNSTPGDTESPLFTSTDTAVSGSARNYTYASRVNATSATSRTNTTGGTSTSSSSKQTLSIPATARDRNNTTDSSAAEEIKIRFVPFVQSVFPAGYNMPVTLSDGTLLTAGTAYASVGNAASVNTITQLSDLPSGAWDLEVTYPKDRTVYHVPVAVIGNNLYLHFTVKPLSQNIENMSADEIAASQGRTKVADDTTTSKTGAVENPDQLLGFWQDNGNASGILISPPYTSTELLSYYITKNAVYHIRYWQTDMEYDSEAKAVFSDGDDMYTVKKHLLVGGLVYTCVNGRGTKIRNIKKSAALPERYTLGTVLATKTVVDEDGTTRTVTEQESTICALGEPYLSLTDGKQTLEQLILAANSRHKPLPKPPFAPSNVDFHWDIIRDLRKYNALFMFSKN